MAILVKVTWAIVSVIAQLFKGKMYHKYFTYFIIYFLSFFNHCNFVSGKYILTYLRTYLLTYLLTYLTKWDLNKFSMSQLSSVWIRVG